MVNFTVDEIRDMMDKPNDIRNISVIAHVDHGKSTLTDSLIGAAGIIAVQKAGDARFMDTRDDEQDRTITIKSTAVSLHFSMDIRKKDSEETENRSFLVNLIDSPGHVDFSSEVTAALRVTDGALVVVDCIEGVCVQTETVLRQAIAERIKPVLFVNKLDRCFLELHMDLEDAFKAFSKAVESVNVVIATYNDDLLGDVQVYPEKGTVGFGSGLHGWGFTVTQFAKMYSKKFGVTEEKMMKRLWGDNFFNPKTGKWSTKQLAKDGSKKERGFVSFILKPINTLFEAVMSEKTEIYTKLLKKLNVTIPKDAVDLRQKKLLKRIMQTWLPAHTALLEMIALHLPSPAVAQKYRVSNLYAGPETDECAKAIAACDSSGPLMMYISKMVPTSEKGRFYAFGRVFAGTISGGQECRIQGPDYEVGKKKDLFKKKIQRVVLMMGRYVEQLVDCPCGNICGLVGVDQYLLKSGTITTHKDAHNFHMMKYSVSPVVQVAVEPKNASDLPKLMEGLKRLSKSDPLVQTFTAKTGEHIVAGCGELHIEICIKDLADDFMKGAPIIVSKPVVSYCETVSESTTADCIGKSPNKHNRIYLRAAPLGEKVCVAIEEDKIGNNQDYKKRARLLADDYEWNVGEARKIWTFGSLDSKCNVLVDTTKAVQYLNEVKDSMVGAFVQAASAGIILEENCRGIRFNLMDVKLHADAIHRGAGQIMPPFKRAFYCCQLRSGPKIMEPYYICNITVPQQAMSGVYTTLSGRRGEVVAQIDRDGTPITLIKAYLPVMESFGFTQVLRQNTSGQAFPQLSFDHWDIMNGDMYDEQSKVGEVVRSVRKRKGLKDALPIWQSYYDKV